MSFVEGFSKSLGAYFTNKAVEDERTKRENDTWEWRQKKAMELEDELTKRRVTDIEYFESNGKVMAQPVNANGEPVGQAREARKAEAERRAAQIEEAGRKKRKDEASIRRDEVATEKDELDTKYLPDRERRAEAMNQAQIGQMRDYAASARANTERTNIENELLRKGQPLPGKEPKPTTPKPATEDAINKRMEWAVEMGLEDDQLAMVIITDPSLTPQQVITKLEQRKKQIEARQNTNNPSVPSSDMPTILNRLSPNYK